MPKITVDGREVEIDAGLTLIAAIDKLGISIPRYCYHPRLPIAGNCRMCLVEVEKMPKLVTSCILSMEHVAHDPVLCIKQRGDHSEITVFPGHRLDSRYSINTTDVCPVGALTSREFRFRKRVWFLKHAKSVCPNCATGCPVI